MFIRLKLTSEERAANKAPRVYDAVDGVVLSEDETLQIFVRFETSEGIWMCIPTKLIDTITIEKP